MERKVAACSTPPSPTSAPLSRSPATHPISPIQPKPQVDDPTKKCVADVLEKKPDIDTVGDLDCAENLEKYKKYEADYVRRLQAKYFSKNNIYGGIIFDEKMIIDGETIKSSRWPCTRSYADPVKGFEDLHGGASAAGYHS